jgi:hypothetical protein
MYRDLHDNLSTALLVAPQTATADITPVSVDLLGFRSAMVMLYIGIGGITFTTTNKIEYILEHSNDNTNWDIVTQSAVLGPTVAAGGIVRSLVAAKAAADIQEISYIGGRRYIRLTPDFGGTHATGTPMTAFVVRGMPEQMPAA